MLKTTKDVYVSQHVRNELISEWNLVFGSSMVCCREITCFIFPCFAVISDKVIYYVKLCVKVLQLGIRITNYMNVKAYV